MAKPKFKKEDLIKILEDPWKNLGQQFINECEMSSLELAKYLDVSGSAVRALRGNEDKYPNARQLSKILKGAIKYWDIK